MSVLAAIVNDVVVTVLTDTSVSVSWKRLPLSEIIYYIVLYSPTGKTMKQSKEAIIVVKSTESSVDISGLISSAEYQFQVVAQAVVNGENIVGQRSLLNTLPPSTTCTCISLGERLNMLYKLYIVICGHVLY